MSDWFKKLKKHFSKDTNAEADVLFAMTEAKEQNNLSNEMFAMLEGVMRLAKMQASDVMVPKPSMIMIKDTANLQGIIAEIAESAHSRYPVINEENPDEVMGILLAKDLLAYSIALQEKPFSVKHIMRQVLVVPESKRLDTLLREFRATHNHMAIVVDEHGTVLGLVTIEDVLEEIVGEIEDEYDLEAQKSIVALSKNVYKVNAQLDLDDFNLHFSCGFESEAFNTIGGIVMHAFGYLPKIGEEITLQGIHFKVSRSDERQIYTLEVRIPEADEISANSANID